MESRLILVVSPAGVDKDQNFPWDSFWSKKLKSSKILPIGPPREPSPWGYATHEDRNVLRSVFLRPGKHKCFLASICLEPAQVEFSTSFVSNFSS